MQRQGVWYGSVAPGGNRLFCGRHYRRLALDDGRIIVSTRRGQVLLDVPVRALKLSGVHQGLLLQVLAYDRTERTYVFEFRPRHRAGGRALADALR